MSSKPLSRQYLRKALHVEGDLFALWAHDDLALQVDGELVAGEGGHFVKQLGRPWLRAARWAAGRS